MDLLNLGPESTTTSSAELLNLNPPHPVTTTTAANLLGDLFLAPEQPISANPPPSNPFFTLDPFDPLPATAGRQWDSLLQDSTGSNGGHRPATLPTMPRNASTPNFESKLPATGNGDPLADLGELMAGLKSSPSGSSVASSPLHKPMATWNTKPTATSATSANVKTPSEAQPDYSRTHFDSVFGRNDYGNIYSIHS